MTPLPILLVIADRSGDNENHDRFTPVRFRGAFGFLVGEKGKKMTKGNSIRNARIGLAVRSLVVGAGIAAAGVIAPTSAIAQPGEQWTVGTPWTGEMGITESVKTIMERARLEPPVDPANPKEAGFEGEEHEPDRDGLPQAPGAQAVSQWPWNPANFFPIDYSQHVAPAAPQTVGLNFVGAQISEAGFVPPDNHGDVGPTQVLVCVNGRIKVFDKATGALGGLNASTNTFFTSVRNGSTTSDPRVRFDRLTNRWFVLMINVSTPNRILLAVSSGPTITSSASFTFFQFDHTSNGGGTADANTLYDYPSLGIDANAIYTGGNIFTTTAYLGASVHVIRKSSVLGAGPIVATAFRRISTPSADGIYTPMGVNNDDPASGNGYFIGTSTTVFSQLDMRRIGTPGGTPTLGANVTITVPTTVNPQPVSVLGSTGALAAIDDRLYGAMMTRNRVTGARTLWTAHHGEVNASGVASTSGNRNGVRWYQIQNLDTTPSLVQSGTLFDSAATNPRSFWFGSIAQSGQGHVAIGCSTGGLANRADAAVSGRLRTDPSGTTQAATFVTSTASNYNAQTGEQRWGDYSFVGVDPSDDQTMWAFHEWCNSGNSWATHVTKLIAPPPSVPATISPNNGNQGAAVNVTITGTPAAGSEFYDTEAGFNRLAIALGGTGITVSNIVWSGATPNQATATLTIGAGAATGARTVTVTNPDGQSRTSASGIFTVNSGSVCPTYSLQPLPATLCSGGSASFTVAANGSPAPTYQWQKNTVNISNGGNISGATSATLTINPVGAGDVGTYRCVATNACGSTNSNNAALAVNASPTISVHPAGGTGFVGQNFMFSVSASGASGYQWRKNTSNIGGAVSPSYSIPVLALGDAGSYDVVVSNSCGSVTSNAAILEVFCLADFNRDGGVDFFDYLDFVDAFSLEQPSADFNGSGAIDFFDYLDFVDQYSIGC